MTGSVCREHTHIMSGPATFSYAQAAKGKAAAQANTPSTAAPSQTDLQAKDDASSVTTGPDGAANTFSTTSEVSESAKSSQIDVEVTGSRKDSETTVDANGVTTMVKDETAGATRAASETAATAANSDKSTRPSNRSSEAADSKKGRKSRKGKSSDKETEGEQATAEPEKEVVPVKLLEAPLPAINIWQQRAAAAKAKQPSPSTQPTSAETASSSGADAAAKTEGNAEAQPSGTAARGPIKSTEASRPSVEAGARKNPRGSRLGDKSEASATFPPSAAENVSLWPTPDTAAAEDEKRKIGSDADKEKQDEGVKASRPKRDWKKVEITPTVVFNTPLPQQRAINKSRGGAQAGRSSASRGHAPSVSVSGDKPQSASADAATPKEAGEVQSRPREETQPRATSVPSEKAKRFPTDQQNPRKQSVPLVNRATGEYAGSKNESSKSAKHNNDSNTFVPRGEGQESFRKEGGYPSHKESKPRRGGGHGRGGHNGQQSFIPNGHNSRSNTYSPPNYTPGFSSNTYGGSRGGRGRPVPLANGNSLKAASNGASRIHAPSHSTLPDYNQFQSYGFAPYSPQPGYAPDPYPNLVHEALKKQIEYYFSDPNLEKDSFLKAQMDAQGFVPFDVIATFPRIRSMSSQTIEYVRLACADSEDVDFVIADGHKELVRCRKNWQRWVLEGDAKGQTDQPRNAGPSNFVYRSWHSAHLNPGNSNYYQQQPMPFPTYNPISPPPTFSPGQAFPGDVYRGYSKGHQFSQAVNGAPTNEQPAADNSSLNASVPEFSPITGSTGVPMSGAFSTLNWEEQTIQSAETFTDEEVAQLHMVAQGKLSNGVTDGSSGSEEQHVAKTNGASAGSETLMTCVTLKTLDENNSLTYAADLNWLLVMKVSPHRPTGVSMAP